MIYNIYISPKKSKKQFDLTLTLKIARLFFFFHLDTYSRLDFIEVLGGGLGDFFLASEVGMCVLTIVYC